MKGSEKQIAWAKEIEAKYNHLVDTFGGQKIECDDASFWITHGQVTNIGFEILPVKLEAWNFLRSDLFVDKASLRSQSQNGLITRDAAQLILRDEVK
jgi:hypothetical protein